MLRKIFYLQLDADSFKLISKTNKYQLTEKSYSCTMLQSYVQNITIANFTRPVFNAFDKGKGCIAAPNHIRCTVPKYATPE